jgi:hypothetical protein
MSHIVTFRRSDRQWVVAGLRPRTTSTSSSSTRWDQPCGAPRAHQRAQRTRLAGRQLDIQAARAQRRRGRLQAEQRRVDHEQHPARSQVTRCGGAHAVEQRASVAAGVPRAHQPARGTGVREPVRARLERLLGAPPPTLDGAGRQRALAAERGLRGLVAALADGFVSPTDPVG